MPGDTDKAIRSSVKIDTLEQPYPNGKSGILFADRADHSRYRKLLSHAFLDGSMREQQPVVHSYVGLLIAGLRKNATERSQDMVQWFNGTTFDIISRLSFGEDFGCLQEGRTHPWIAAIFGSTKAVVLGMAIPRLGLEKLLPYLMSAKILAVRKYNYETVVNKINERVKRGTE